MRCLQVYRPGQRGAILLETDELEGEAVLPGFLVAVREIFRPLALLQPLEDASQVTSTG